MSVCILWLHPYTVTPTNLDQSLAILGSLSSWNDATMSWLRLKTTFDCFSHPYWTHIFCFCTFQWCLWAYECTLTLLHQHNWVDTGTSAGSNFKHYTVEWKWCQMSWLGCRPPLIASHHIFIVHIHSDLGPFHDVSGYMSVSSPPLPTKTRSDFGNSGWLSSENDAMMAWSWCHCWGCRPPLIASHIHLGGKVGDMLVTCLLEEFGSAGSSLF
jgi:hypothetical protein